MADTQPKGPVERLGGLFDGREEYAPLSDGGKRTALIEGLIVVDTNVLLHVYRFGAEARDELMTVLGLLKDRLFVPDQVATEFMRNRLSVAMEMREELAKEAENASQTLNELGERLQALGRTQGLSQEQKRTLTRMLRRTENKVRKLLDTAVEGREWADHPSSTDPLLPELTKLLAGKVGRPYSERRTTELRAEAKKRIDAKVPPGFKDTKKDDPSGDFFVWRQILDEAKVRKEESVLLISDDVKEDWVLRVRGRTVGPLPALIREAKDQAGVDFYVSTVASFLILAREALQATVSEGTIEEATQRPASKVFISNNDSTTGAVERAMLESMLHWSNLVDLTPVVPPGAVVGDAIRRSLADIDYEDAARRLLIEMKRSQRIDAPDAEGDVADEAPSDEEDNGDS